MYTLEQLQNIIAAEIEKVEWKKQPVELYEPVEYILALGGKRIRPALVLMGCNMFSDQIMHALKPAIGYEVFHNFTLLHDDIMDKSPMRRGKPTVHTKWNDNVAILSGDAMQILAYKFIAETPNLYLKHILDLFSQTALEVCEGQQMDMNFENRNNVTIPEYIEMIRLKTSVLLAACLKTGAVLGGARQDDFRNMYQTGLNLGLAFQLQDDLLDVYGDPLIFGKKIGGDIIAAKKTFLLITAFEKATGSLKEKLFDLIYNAKLENQEKVKSVTEIYNQLNIKEETLLKIDFYYNEALKSIEKIQLPDEKKSELLLFAKNLMQRNK